MSFVNVFLLLLNCVIYYYLINATYLHNVKKLNWKFKIDYETKDRVRQCSVRNSEYELENKIL